MYVPISANHLNLSYGNSPTRKRQPDFPSETAPARSSAKPLLAQPRKKCRTSTISVKGNPERASPPACDTCYQPAQPKMSASHTMPCGSCNGSTTRRICMIPRQRRLHKFSRPLDLSFPQMEIRPFASSPHRFAGSWPCNCTASTASCTMTRWLRANLHPWICMATRGTMALSRRSIVPLF